VKIWVHKSFLWVHHLIVLQKDRVSSPPTSSELDSLCNSWQSVLEQKRTALESQYTAPCVTGLIFVSLIPGQFRYRKVESFPCLSLNVLYKTRSFNQKIQPEENREFS
jgi:hypothetical protein